MNKSDRFEYRVFWFRPLRAEFTPDDYDIGVYEHGRRSRTLENDLSETERHNLAKTDYENRQI